jgi:hypothetical protein
MLIAIPRTSWPLSKRESVLSIDASDFRNQGIALIKKSRIPCRPAERWEIISMAVEKYKNRAVDS